MVEVDPSRIHRIRNLAFCIFPVVICGIRTDPIQHPTTVPNGREWIRPSVTTFSPRLLSFSRPRVRGFGYVVRNIFPCLFPDAIFWRLRQLLFCPRMVRRASLCRRGVGVVVCVQIFRKPDTRGRPKSTGGQGGLRRMVDEGKKVRMHPFFFSSCQ